MRIVLFQPRYPHGGRRQIYLPGGLMNLGARLMQAGATPSFVDLNTHELDGDDAVAALLCADRIGLTVLGTPYIPVVRRVATQMRDRGYSQPILVGGEGIVRITPEQFSRIYGHLGNIHQVVSDAELSQTIGLRRVPSAFETSMAPMLETLSLRQQRAYLGREFCLFLSNGCIFNCRFCAASKGVPERYRSQNSLEHEIVNICAALAEDGRKELRVYLSNLDVMQSPDKLEECLQVVWSYTKAYGIAFACRGLATTRCTMSALKHDPQILQRLHSYGLRCLGFGVDGADVRVWQRENKKHNSLIEIDAAIRAMQEAGIDSEILMITGFPEDDARSMWQALRYTVLALGPGVYLRPYLAKKGAPGSDPWSVDAVLREPYLANPERFTDLDYAMFGSPTTHPERRQRWLANATYAAMVTASALRGRCHTPPLLPEVGGLIRRRTAHLINRLMPFDP